MLRGRLFGGEIAGRAVGYLSGYFVAWGDRNEWMTTGMQKLSGMAAILYIFIVSGNRLPGMEIIYATAMLTVLISVFAHGITAAPGAEWYAKRIAKVASPDSNEMQKVSEMPFVLSGPAAFHPLDAGIGDVYPDFDIDEDYRQKPCQGLEPSQGSLYLNKLYLKGNAPCRE